MATLSLRALLGLDSSGFEKGIDRSRGKVGLIKKEFGALKNQIAAAFSVAFVARHTNAIIKNGAAIYDQAKRLNISTTELQRHKYALEQNGNTIEELAISFLALEKARERALGGDQKTLDQFAKLGIGQNDLSSLSTNDLFLKGSDSVKSFTGNIDELKTTLVGVFGETGVKMLQTFTEGFRNLGDEIENIGGVMDKHLIKKMKDFDGLMMKYKVLGKAKGAEAIGAMEKGFYAGQGIANIRKMLFSTFVKLDIKGARENYHQAIDSFTKMFGGTGPESFGPTVIPERSSSGRSGANSGGFDPPSVNTPALRPPSFAVNDPLVGIGNFLLAQRSTVDIQKQQLQKMDAILSMITTAISKGI